MLIVRIAIKFNMTMRNTYAEKSATYVAKAEAIENNGAEIRYNTSVDI